MSGIANTAPTPSAQWGVPEAVGGWFGAQLLAVVWAGLVAGFEAGGVAGQSGRSSIWWFLAGGIGLWLAYVVVAAWLATRTKVAFSQVFGLRLSPLAIVMGLACGVACQLGLVPAVYWVVGDRIAGDPEVAARELISLVSGPAATAALVVAVVIVAPVAEELMYRGVLIRALDAHVGRVGAVVLSSIVFAVAHGQLILIPGLMVFAIVLGLAAYVFDGLTMPIAAHMSFNATTVVLLLA